MPKLLLISVWSSFPPSMISFIDEDIVYGIKLCQGSFGLLWSNLLTTINNTSNHHSTITFIYRALSSNLWGIFWKDSKIHLACICFLTVVMYQMSWEVVITGSSIQWFFPGMLSLLPAIHSLTMSLDIRVLSELSRCGGLASINWLCWFLNL